MKKIIYPVMSVQVSFHSDTLPLPAADALIIPVHPDDLETFSPRGPLGYVDANTGGTLRKILEKRVFTGKPESHIHIGGSGRFPFDDIIICGVGEGTPDASALLGAAASGMHAAMSHRASDIVIWPSGTVTKIGPRQHASLITQAALLAGYRFVKYKKPDQADVIPGLVRLIAQKRDASEVKEGIKEGMRMARATYVARDLVNEPPSVTTPSFLASVAQTTAADDPSCGITVLDEKQLKEQGFGGMLAVSKGSDEPPRLIVLERGNKKERPIVLVGKGVTFDSGGLSLKPSGHMESMKTDMAGAAAVLGVFHGLGQSASERHVVGIIPAVENMPSGKAIKPGDVIRMYDGTSVEILNTDAEGRLIIADAIAYARKLFEPASIIDIATLTGACVVALGEDITGLFANSDALAQAIARSAARVGEDVWRMPLFKGYARQMKSPLADLKNVSASRYGGAITAALFVKEFVGDVPWAHLDVAGPAWQEKGMPLLPKGGTGSMVRTMLDMILSNDSVVS